MQEKTANVIDTAYEQSKVVVYSGHGDMDMDLACEKGLFRRKIKVATVTGKQRHCSCG
jgi:hypothetical protein